MAVRDRHDRGSGGWGSSFVFWEREYKGRRGAVRPAGLDGAVGSALDEGHSAANYCTHFNPARGHYFGKHDNGWVPAGELRKGERLLAADGSTPQVKSFTPRPEPEPVYNIEVEGDHCYRVGEQGLLVHNVSNPCMPKAGWVKYGNLRPVTFEDENGNEVTGQAGENASAYLTPANVGGARSDFNEIAWFQKLRKVAGKPIEMGHILASSLGGSGVKNWNNLTPLYADANAPAISTCENFLAKLVTECHLCVTVKITVRGYGRNKEAPMKARPAFPSSILIEWSSDGGCESGSFEVTNKHGVEVPTKCQVEKLPCRK